MSAPPFNIILGTDTNRDGAVTQADVQRVARQYVDPDRLTIVVVGDRKVIEPGIRSLKLDELRPIEALQILAELQKELQ